VTGRVGYTWGPALLYVKGGYAYSDYSDSLTFNLVPQPFALSSNHHDGYTVGAGLEYMFAQNWSAKVEYQYYNFGNTSFVTPTVLTAFGSTRNDEHTVKAGINYRFNWGGPVVAKY
jgi:outer membrane immunogenic protein